MGSRILGITFSFSGVTRNLGFDESYLGLDESYLGLSNNAILKYKIDLVVKELLHVFERSVQKSRSLDLEKSENPYIYHLGPQD